MMMKMIMLAISLMVATMTGSNHVVTAHGVDQVNEENTLIDIWYLYSNEDGTFWLEYGEEMDVITFIDYETLEKSNISMNNLYYGLKLTGTFEGENVEMYNIDSYTVVENKDIPLKVKESIFDNIVYELERLYNES